MTGAWIVVALCVAAPICAAGLGVWREVVANSRAAQVAVERGVAEIQEARVGSILDPAAHDAMRSASIATRSYDGAQVAAARTQLESLRERLVRNRRIERAASVGRGYAHHEVGVDLMRYAKQGDGRNRWSRFIQAALDDIRLIHTRRIERATLELTCWSRALLLAATPLLAPVTFAAMPLEADRSTWSTRLWIVCTAYALIVGLFAPTISDIVLERSARAHALRRRLVLIEAPLSTAMIVAFPGWPIIAFAAGWTNWWQRNARPPSERAAFSWHRLGVYLGATIAAIVIGGWMTGMSATAVAIEGAVGLLVILIIGGSYGAMLPVTLAFVIHSLSSVRRGCSLHTQRRALDEANALVDALRRAADEIDEHDAPDSTRDAGALRDAARLLEQRMTEPEVYRGPANLARVIDDAIFGVRAEFLIAPLPVDLAAAQFEQPDDAPIMHEALRLCAREAMTHGVGAVDVIIVLDADHIVIRMANEARADRQPGHGYGTSRVRTLVEEQLAGTFSVHSAVDSTFVDGTGDTTLYGVEIKLPRSMMRVA